MLARRAARIVAVFLACVGLLSACGGSSSGASAPKGDVAGFRREIERENGVPIQSETAFKSLVSSARKDCAEHDTKLLAVVWADMKDQGAGNLFDAEIRYFCPARKAEVAKFEAALK